jgi:glucosamine-6-phosphate isomerase
MIKQMIVAGGYADVSRRAARVTANFINGNPGALLCLAAGDTPLGAYRELVGLQASGEVDLASVYYAGLDEWVGLCVKDKGSCEQVMRGHFYGPAGIPQDRVHVFDGLKNPANECKAMDDWLKARGGIAFTLLGVGLNGHVGFNEPHVPEADGAVIVPLDETTKNVSEKYFGKAMPVSAGVTIGLTALKKARQIVVMASGANKADIIRRAFEEPASPGVPASLLQTHHDLILMLDRESAGV